MLLVNVAHDWLMCVGTLGTVALAALLIGLVLLQVIGQRIDWR